jgi:hypothetical protein
MVVRVMPRLASGGCWTWHLHRKIRPPGTRSL